MKYIRLNQTDLELSNICLGAGQMGITLSKEDSFLLLDEFAKNGGNFIDTANIYGKWVPGLGNVSERVIGEWMKKRGVKQEIVVATKGAHYLFDTPQRIPRVNEQDVRMDLEESLSSLGLDRIDFYWLHRDDRTKPIEEIIDIMEKLRTEGKIRFYGLSNYQQDRLEAAMAYLESKHLPGPFAVSNQWSLAWNSMCKTESSDPTLVGFSEAEFEWHCKTEIPAIPYSSTAFGFFTKLKMAGVKVENGRLQNPDSLSKISDQLKLIYLNEENLRRYERL